MIISESLLSMNIRTDRRLLERFAYDLEKDMGGLRDVIGLGAGRMGYSLRGFIMRLCHFGYNAFMYGDTNVPRLNENTVLLVNSSSSETRSVLNLVEIAYEKGVRNIYVVTANPHGSIANLAKYVFTMPESTGGIMKTNYEAYSMLLFDAIAKYYVDMNLTDLRFAENNHTDLE